MNLFDIILLSFALATDAMLVCFSYGLSLKDKRLRYSLYLAAAFGLFQFIMPVLGGQFSALFYDILSLYSKWVVFIIFIFLGCKFLKDSFSKKDDKKTCDISFICLFCLAVATSIDAFGAGITLKFAAVNIIKSSFIIGIITFILSFAGFWFSGIFKNMESKYIEVTGALILMFLAVKALI